MSESSSVQRTIFIAGSGGTAWTHPAFLRALIARTGKDRPKIAYVPTASGDHPTGIVNWYAACEGLPLQPFVLRTFLSSSPEQRSFAEFICDMDALVVGGGSTLNMIAIWKAQGIDTALRQAYERGIVLAGGSAGSLCWFEGGYSDSRPKELSIVAGLSFLPFSHCPHYSSEPARKPLYVAAIRDGRLKGGYACDDGAGLVFVNEALKEAVALSESHGNYFLHLENGDVVEERIPSTILE